MSGILSSHAPALFALFLLVVQPPGQLVCVLLVSEAGEIFALS